MARDGHSNELVELYPDLVFASVMLDSGTDMSSLVAQWATEYGLHHPVLADNAGVTSPFVTAGYPTYVLLDKDLVVRSLDLWGQGGEYPFAASVLEEYF